ncbi:MULTISPECIES: hypothetical protein [Bacillus cereus group]|uniref:hypothetical protein n=1 Tax=Bacillus cereus group TaxID=86661 RepID=UPI000BF793F1|nr:MULTISPECIES: hypothetical protein [Bacillus cereus group]MDO6633241.1 hypothetical protein [Bacillus thuringiensis]MDO6662567.1 hypothetical protein [Bacillus thuringiensis]MDO6703422.1 hypothetical protein [Bacillus thuringiensis]PEV76341.1 hypothetical protein CN437_22460 [Bacillus cereus]
MKYFEFDKHEYWALVAAETKGRAYTVYAKEVAGNGTQSVISEGDITEVTKEIAFGKFLNAVAHLEENKGKNLQDYLNDFNGHENQTVLITSELA